FQLLNYQTLNTKSTAGGTETVEVLKSWDALGEEILQSCNGFLNRDKTARDIITSFTAANDTPKEKLRKIFNFVQDNYAWNEFWSIYPSRPFNEFESSRKGSTSEINLLLTTLLREAGWEADPVLVSTRYHGKVIQSFPLLSQFNNLICRAISGTDTLFLDAAARRHKYPYFLLAKENLNFYGFLIKKNNFNWINITSWKDSRSNASLKIDLVNGTGEWKSRLEGYTAMDERYNWQRQKEKYSLFAKAPELSEQAVQLGVPIVEAAEELEKPFLVSYTFPVEKPDATLYYISLSDWTRFSEVPFKMPERSFPVEMDYPFSDNLVATITIPPGYSIESLPKDVTVQLNIGREAGRFTFTAKILNNQVVITSRIFMKDVIFNADLYKSLKSFYEQIHSKFNEVIVLKKQ
ncbi:MAG: transglutaminase-like domain-containing protein, partial [Saprospiraceae bacterium]